MRSRLAEESMSLNLSLKNDIFNIMMMSVKKKRRLLLLLVLALAPISVGCTGSQEIVEPSRDSFNAGEVEVRSFGNAEAK